MAVLLKFDGSNAPELYSVCKKVVDKYETIVKSIDLASEGMTHAFVDAHNGDVMVRTGFENNGIFFQLALTPDEATTLKTRARVLRSGSFSQIMEQIKKESHYRARIYMTVQYRYREDIWIVRYNDDDITDDVVGILERLIPYVMEYLLERVYYLNEYRDVVVGPDYYITCVDYYGLKEESNYVSKRKRKKKRNQ